MKCYVLVVSYVNKQQQTLQKLLFFIGYVYILFVA